MTINSPAGCHRSNGFLVKAPFIALLAIVICSQSTNAQQFCPTPGGGGGGRTGGTAAGTGNATGAGGPGVGTAGLPSPGSAPDLVRDFFLQQQLRHQQLTGSMSGVRMRSPVSAAARTLSASANRRAIRRGTSRGMSLQRRREIAQALSQRRAEQTDETADDLEDEAESTTAEASGAGETSAETEAATATAEEPEIPEIFRN